MIRHLDQLYGIMAPGSLAGYVVADQASNRQVEIPTATILDELVEDKVGFEKKGIKLWRSVASTTGKKEDLFTEILVLQKLE